MKTKKLFLTMIAAATMVFAGCSDSDNDESSDDSSFMVEPTNISASVEGGHWDYDVAALTVWSAEVEGAAQSWCRIRISGSSYNTTRVSGNGDDYGEVYVDRNSSGNSRSATITFSSGTSKRTLRVAQPGQ
jgi:hypothetical protein